MTVANFVTWILGAIGILVCLVYIGLLLWERWNVKRGKERPPQ